MNRYLCRGRRCDNGDWVTGYCVEDEHAEYKSLIVKCLSVETDNKGYSDILEHEIYQVDPATVEPVKVAPDSTPVAFGAFAPICPNCKQQLSGEKYCPDCGQAIDWGEGSAE